MEPLGDRIVPVADVSVAAFGVFAPEDGVITFLLNRTDTTGNLTVNLTTGGTATHWTDYIAPGTVSFTSGSDTASVTMLLLDDSASEPTETLTLTVAPGTGYNVGTPATATVLILDNDAQVVSVAAVNDAVEGGTAGTLRFTRTGDLTSSLTANYSVGGTAAPGTDFTALTGTVTFAASSATADVTVAALHDGVIDDDDETVSVTVTSGTGYAVGSPASDSITIIDTDILPVAFDGWVTTSVNKDADVEVLDLATSLYGDTLTVTGVTDGEHGAVVINLDGTVTYTPDTDFVGDDTFTYTVEDPFGNEATGTVSVTVTAPVAPPTSVWTATNTAVTVEVLDLAFDPDGDTLTTVAVTQGTNGTVVVNVDGTVAYTPNTSFTGDDSFTYTVEDPDGNEASHTITVTVGPTDPVALDTAVQTDTDTPVIASLADLAFQPAGGSATFTVSSAAHGTAVDNFDGTVTYTPDTSYTGTDAFSYFVADASLSTASGTITVTVGTTSPTVADAVIAALGDVEDLVAGYTTGTADGVADAVANLVPDLNDYLDDVTSLISANSIDPNGANKLHKQFVEDEVAAYKAIHKSFTSLANTYATMKSATLASKNLIELLSGEMVANPDPVLAAALQHALPVLMDSHSRLLHMVYGI